jgi:hypothetical protein
VPGIQRERERELYLIRDFIRFTSSRELRVVELGANDRLSARSVHEQRRSGEKRSNES